MTSLQNDQGNSHERFRSVVRVLLRAHQPMFRSTRITSLDSVQNLQKYNLPLFLGNFYVLPSHDYIKQDEKLYGTWKNHSRWLRRTPKKTDVYLNKRGRSYLLSYDDVMTNEASATKPENRIEYIKTKRTITVIDENGIMKIESYKAEPYDAKTFQSTIVTVVNNTATIFADIGRIIRDLIQQAEHLPPSPEHYSLPVKTQPITTTMKYSMDQLVDNLLRPPYDKNAFETFEKIIKSPSIDEALTGKNDENPKWEIKVSAAGKLIDIVNTRKMVTEQDLRERGWFIPESGMQPEDLPRPPDVKGYVQQTWTKMHYPDMWAIYTDPNKKVLQLGDNTLRLANIMNGRLSSPRRTYSSEPRLPRLFPPPPPSPSSQPPYPPATVDGDPNVLLSSEADVRFDSGGVQKKTIQLRNTGKIKIIGEYGKKYYIDSVSENKIIGSIQIPEQQGNYSHEHVEFTNVDPKFVNEAKQIILRRNPVRKIKPDRKKMEGFAPYQKPVGRLDPSF